MLALVITHLSNEMLVVVPKPCGLFVIVAVHTVTDVGVIELHHVILHTTRLWVLNEEVLGFEVVNDFLDPV